MHPLNRAQFGGKADLHGSAKIPLIESDIGGIREQLPSPQVGGHSPQLAASSPLQALLNSTAKHSALKAAIER